MFVMPADLGGPESRA